MLRRRTDERAVAAADTRTPPPRPTSLVGLAAWPVTASIDLITRTLAQPSTQRIVFWLAVLAVLYMLSLTGALAAYYGFYRTWVSQVSIVRDVWLQFGYVAADRTASPSAALRLQHSRSDLPLWSDPTASAASFFVQDLTYDVAIDIDFAAALAPTPVTVQLELQSELAEPLYAAQRPLVLQNTHRLLDWRRTLWLRRTRVHHTLPLLHGITPHPSRSNAHAMARAFGGSAPEHAVVLRASVAIALDSAVREKSVLNALADGAVRLRFDAQLAGIACVAADPLLHVPPPDHHARDIRDWIHDYRARHRHHAVARRRVLLLAAGAADAKAQGFGRIVTHRP